MKRIFPTLSLGLYKHNKGFTLVELIVVISIIGILSSLLVANFMNVRYKTRDAVRKKDLNQIQLALEVYKNDAGNYPSTLYATSCPTSSSLESSSGTVYMEKIPCDPLDKSNYVYERNTSTDLRYTLSICIENENDQDQNVVSDTNCESGKRFVMHNP